MIKSKPAGAEITTRRVIEISEEALRRILIDRYGAAADATIDLSDIYTTGIKLVWNQPDYTAPKVNYRGAESAFDR
jgi:hypothetical protein